MRKIVITNPVIEQGLPLINRSTFVKELEKHIFFRGTKERIYVSASLFVVSKPFKPSSMSNKILNMLVVNFLVGLVTIKSTHSGRTLDKTMLDTKEQIYPDLIEAAVEFIYENFAQLNQLDEVEARFLGEEYKNDIKARL